MKNTINDKLLKNIRFEAQAKLAKDKKYQDIHNKYLEKAGLYRPIKGMWGKFVRALGFNKKPTDFRGKRYARTIFKETLLNSMNTKLLQLSGSKLLKNYEPTAEGLNFIQSLPDPTRTRGFGLALETMAHNFMVGECSLDDIKYSIETYYQDNDRIEKATEILTNHIRKELKEYVNTLNNAREYNLISEEIYKNNFQKISNIYKSLPKNLAINRPEEMIKLSDDLHEIDVKYDLHVSEQENIHQMPIQPHGTQATESHHSTHSIQTDLRGSTTSTRHQAKTHQTDPKVTQSTHSKDQNSNNPVTISSKDSESTRDVIYNSGYEQVLPPEKSKQISGPPTSPSPNTVSVIRSLSHGE